MNVTAAAGKTSAVNHPNNSALDASFDSALSEIASDALDPQDNRLDQAKLKLSELRKESIQKAGQLLDKSKKQIAGSWRYFKSLYWPTASEVERQYENNPVTADDGNNLKNCLALDKKIQQLKDFQNSYRQSLWYTPHYSAKAILIVAGFINLLRALWKWKNNPYSADIRLEVLQACQQKEVKNIRGDSGLSSEKKIDRILQILDECPEIAKNASRQSFWQIYKSSILEVLAISVGATIAANAFSYWTAIRHAGLEEIVLQRLFNARNCRDIIKKGKKDARKLGMDVHDLANGNGHNGVENTTEIDNSDTATI